MRIRIQICFQLAVAVLFGWSHQATGQQIPDPILLEFARMQDQRKARGEPLLTLMDLVDMYGEERKRKLVNALPSKGLPLLPIRGRWGFIDDPSVALPWALAEKEPLSAEVLEVLRKTFPKSTDPEDRVKLAVLLYRYREPGSLPPILEYFRDNPDKDIALLLALNQEESALSGIREVFRNHRANDDFIYAMGRWEESADDLLNEGYLNKLGPRGYYMWAFGMAKHRLDSGVLDHLRAVYRRGRGSTKIKVGMAMHQGSGNPEGLQEFLGEQLVGWRGLRELDVMFITQAILRAPDAGAGRYLGEMVSHFSESPGTIRASDFHLAAARSLAKLQGGESARPLGEMLRKMLANRDANECNIESLAQIIAQSNAPAMTETLVEVGGEELARRAKAMSTLRRVPAELLPFRSKECVAPSYWIE